MNKIRESVANLKASARYSLLGHLGNAVGANLFCFGVSLLLSVTLGNAVTGSSLFSLILSLVLEWLTLVFSGIFDYGRTCLFLNMQYAQPVLMPDLLCGFRENTNQIIQIEMILSGIRTLCLTPGAFAVFYLSDDAPHRFLIIAVLYAAGYAVSVYVRLHYALYPYLLLDYPGSDPFVIMRTSRRLMSGRKVLLFCLHLSFLPLSALGLLSLGIANLWVNAYRCAADAAFYRSVLKGSRQSG